MSDLAFFVVAGFLICACIATFWASIGFILAAIYKVEPAQPAKLFACGPLVWFFGAWFNFEEQEHRKRKAKGLTDQQCERILRSIAQSEEVERRATVIMEGLRITGPGMFEGGGYRVYPHRDRWYAVAPGGKRRASDRSIPEAIRRLVEDELGVVV